MKKVLSAILALIIICSINACSYEPLELEKTEWITCRNNSITVSAIIAEELPDGAKIKATSSNESLVSIQDVESQQNSNNSAIATTAGQTVNDTKSKNIQDKKLVVGDQYGEATVEIIVKNKVATLTVKVVPYIDYLKAEAEKENSYSFYKMDYLAAKWVIDNLEQFKNPTSVSIENVYYSESESTPSYFIMEIRAQNSFGGNSINYCKVTATEIKEVDVTSYGYRIYYLGEALYSSFGYTVNKAVQEYIDINY